MKTAQWESNYSLTSSKTICGFSTVESSAANRLCLFLFCLFVSQLVALEIVLLDGQSITLVWKISQQLMAEMSQTSSLPHGMRFEIEIKSGYRNFSCCAVIS